MVKGMATQFWRVPKTRRAGRKRRSTWAPSRREREKPILSDTTTIRSRKPKYVWLVEDIGNHYFHVLAPTREKALKIARKHGIAVHKMEGAELLT